MSDYTELIKKLRALHRDPRPDSIAWLFDNQLVLYDAAAAIEALQAEAKKWESCTYNEQKEAFKYLQRCRELESKMPHWVSVNDKPPKEENLYMTVHRKNKTARLNWWSKRYGFCYEGSTVEYWMPLPEPPQEDGERREG